MPIKPKSYICKCSQCSFEVGIAPQSDALRPWDIIDYCPECGSKELEQLPLGSFKEKIWRLTGKMSGPEKFK